MQPMCKNLWLKMVLDFFYVFLLCLFFIIGLLWCVSQIEVNPREYNKVIYANNLKINK